MYLSSNECWVLGLIILLVLVFASVVLLLANDIKGVATNKGIKIGIERGLGKPIEDIEEINRILGGKTIKIPIFIVERHCGIFLAETTHNDVTGEGIFYFKLYRWSMSDNHGCMNPKPVSFISFLLKKVLCFLFRFLH